MSMHQIFSIFIKLYYQTNTCNQLLNYINYTTRQQQKQPLHPLVGYVIKEARKADIVEPNDIIQETCYSRGRASQRELRARRREK